MDDTLPVEIIDEGLRRSRSWRVPLPDQPTGRFNSVTGLWVPTEIWRCPLESGGVLVVKPGFESDGASIPRILWPAVGPRYAATTFPAALCHDSLYAAELLTRSVADAEFHRLLRGFGVNRVKAYAYWAFVRAGGWSAYLLHSKESVAAAREVVSIEPCGDCCDIVG